MGRAKMTFRAGGLASMAGKAREKREKMAQDIFHILFVVNVFQCISPCLATVESPNQVFVQTDKELRYLGEGVPLHVVPGESIHEMNIQDDSLTAVPIRFHPQLLDFQERPVGMPHTEQVTVQNPDPVNTLHLLSISGSTIHFHCSFFQDKLVPPGGNTTFEVVFLAREVGNVENTLYIHTSHGSFKYQVFGVGVPNPYRIRPFVGAKMPVNSSFSPLIHMHNPHSSTLQVEEIYTSGGDLHLELPTGEKEAPQDLWEIPPYATKPIMKASFIGRIENNHTAFIRIRTNQDQADDVLVLPVEVEVTSAPGIFSPLEILDFGIIRTLDDPKSLRLSLLNSGSKPVYITNVTVTPANGAVQVDFRPVQLKPDVLQPTTVALISFSASKATHPKQWVGKIVVRSKTENYKLTIPYQATVLHGSLVYDRNKTVFYTGQASLNNVSQDLPITNTFNFTLVVYNVSVPADVQRYFTVENLTSPVYLASQETKSVFVLKFHPNTSLLHLTTSLQLHTNASVFTIPIHVYNGRLKVVHHRPEIFKGQLDFGTLGKSEQRSMTFTLRNDNPLDIRIQDFGSNMDNTVVELLGMERGNGTTLTRDHNASDIDTSPLVLKPYHFAVFSVNLVAPDWEGTFAAEVIITTQYENLYIPMTLRTAEGSLTVDPEKVIFEKCFPGKLSQRELHIRSSFDRYMEVQDLVFKPNDSRFYYVPPKEQPILLQPYQDTYVGKLFFEPRKGCQDDCYTGFPTPSLPLTKEETKTLGYQWLLGLTLDKEVADIDQFLYTKAQHKWDSHNFMQINTVNVTMQLDTSQVRGFLFPAQAHLQWPSLSRKSRINFPLTQIGNISLADLVLENPGGVPVLAQVLALPIYPNPQTILDMLAHSIQSDLSDLVETDDPDIFLLQDLETNSDNPTIQEFRQSVESIFGVKTHQHSAPLLIPGGGRVKLRLGFRPKDDSPRSSLIIIRNNLTVVDAVVVQGQGGRGELKFNTRKTGSQTPLLFELTEKHLKNCHTSSYVVGEKRTKGIPPNFTVRRTFTARNTGQLPLYINNFSINQVPCEGYGFRVLDCHGFEMAPNTSRKIDIAFTPDFTMSRIQRVLSLHTSLGDPLNYTLQATVPAHMLTRCAAALPRLTWEPILFYSTLCIMGFLLFCILVAAYFEADRIFHTDIIKRRQRLLANAYDKNKVLDLRSIGSSFRAQDSSASKVTAGHKTPELSELGNGHAESVPNHVTPHPPRRKKESPWSLWKWWTWTWRSSTNKPLPSALSSNTRDRFPNVDSSSSTSSSTPRTVATTTTTPTTTPTTTTTTNNNNNSSKQPTKPWFWQRLFGGSKRPAKSSAKPDSDLNHSSSSPNMNKVTSNGIPDGRKLSGPNNGLLPSSTPHSNGSSYLNVFSSSSSNPKRRPGSRDALVGDNYVHSYNRQNSDSDGAKDQARLAGHKRAAVEKVSSMGLDSLDSPVLPILDDDDDNSNRREQGKKSRSKKPSKADLRREERERERQLKDKLFKEKVLMELERDDTSSTTTESSSLDPDDKISSARDSTPELTAPKAKKLRAKTKKGKSGSTGLDEEEGNDEDFMISSKSKAQKNIKVDPKMAFGGNVFLPNTYELPYTTKLEAETKERNEKKGSVTQGLTPISLDKPARKTNKTAKNKGVNDLKLEGERPGSTESPPPVWDFPMPQSAVGTGDLSELSIQTEQFAKNAAGRPNNPLLGLNTPLSYSSAVSGAPSDNSPPATRTNVATSGSYGNGTPDSPVDNTLTGLDLKQIGNFGNKQPIGTKPVSPPLTSLQGHQAWGLNLSATSTADNQGTNTFSLPPRQEAERPAQMAAGTDLPVSGSSVFGLQDGLGQFGFAGANNYEQSQQAPVTMMQRLQQDRRQRVQEYQQKVLQDDWPGFNMPSKQPMSLWDNRAPESWSTLTDSPPRPQANQTLWDPPLTSAAATTSASNNWGNPISSLWSGQTAVPPVTSAANTLLDIGTGPPRPEEQGSTSPGGTVYDPFALGSIWNPTSTGSGWGFPPKPDQDPE